MSMMIDFRSIAGERVRNVSGHERGAAARLRYNLDDADTRNEIVEIVIPDDIDAVAASFFLGMFSRSVKYYETKERFLEHYRFFASPAIMEQILRGIDRSMTARNGAAFLH